MNAFDETRFGPTRTLNLRLTLPTAREAVERTDKWLRQQQVEHAGEVLVITGRGNNSPDGISAVRTAVMAHLHSMRRRGVIRGWREHTAGSVVVELAPITALFEQLPRRREPRRSTTSTPRELAGLAPATRNALRRLATRSLETLGVRAVGPFVEAEMVKQLGALAASLPTGSGDREAALLAAVRQALEEIDG